jgi:hypothetical protein
MAMASNAASAVAGTAAVPRNIWQGAEDLWLDVFVAFNFLCLTGDITLAHAANHFRNFAEYIPLGLSPAAFVLVLTGMVLRIKLRQSNGWRYFGLAAGWLSIAVGVAGVVYHLDSAFFYERTIKSLTYAAPFAAPLAYVGLGCLLLMNRMVPAHTREWAEWVLFLALGGFAGNFALSLTDHATNGFYRTSEWIPVISSALAVGFLLTLLLSPSNNSFLSLAAAVLFFQMLVGAAGFALHLLADLHGPSASLYQNIIAGAPPFAPLLFPNLAILGLIGVLALDNAPAPL